MIKTTILNWFNKLKNKKDTDKHIDKLSITTDDLCKCTGEISLIDLLDYSKFDLNNNNHTGCIIYQCSKCNKLHGFPHDNLLLAVNKGSDNTLEFLTRLKNSL